MVFPYVLIIIWKGEELLCTGSFPKCNNQGTDQAESGNSCGWQDKHLRQPLLPPRVGELGLKPPALWDTAVLTSDLPSLSSTFFFFLIKP